MYTTIEADIENGRVIGPESQKLPVSAHVLITLIAPHQKIEDVHGEKGSAKSLFGSLRRFADQGKIAEESGAWCEASGNKYDPR